MSLPGTRSSVIWSIIAAAFIGPGTVTTATRVGAAGGWYYVPVLAAALLGGYLLLEAAARISLVGNRSLTELLGRSGGGLLLRLLVFGGLFVGCAAYQAGNLLGGLAGLRLFAAGIPAWMLVPAAVLIGALLFWGGTSGIGRLMSRLVILMGITFIFTALVGPAAQPPPETVPDLSAFNMLALAGTTIVPYNFFLALRLGRGQQLGAMRRGLALSFALGGVVTLAVLLTGRQLAEFDSFDQLAGVLRQAAGLAGPLFLGIGLCAAGFSSALTAPLAAAAGG
ncbi:MAG: divalent metal cation transporter, partial [Saprospiraceae bacterium]